MSLAEIMKLGNFTSGPVLRCLTCDREMVYIMPLVEDTEEAASTSTMWYCKTCKQADMLVGGTTIEDHSREKN